MKRPDPRGGPAVGGCGGGGLDLAGVRGPGPPRPLGPLELDLVALRQALEALALDGVEVHEHILASLLGDETVALRIIEPLDRTLCHRRALFLSRLYPSVT